jgi:hypothetical protein
MQRLGEGKRLMDNGQLIMKTGAGIFDRKYGTTGPLLHDQ